MKKILVLTMTTILMLMANIAMTACGSSDKGSAGSDGGEVLDGTKTLAYFNKYVSGGAYTMVMKTDYDGTSTSMTSAVKGDMLYSETDMGGTKSIMIMRDGHQYFLDPASKVCMKMSMDMASTSEMFSDKAASYETALNTGTEEINGNSYDYEEFDVDGVSAKYYFDGNELKYITTVMEGETYLMEIVSMEKGADDSLFEIPSNYAVMEY